MQGSKDMWCLAICSLFVLLLSGLDALTKTDTFRYSGFCGLSRIPPLVSKTAATEAVCAMTCAQNAACKSFSFHSGAKRCSLFPRRIVALDVDLSVPSEDSHFSRVFASCPAWNGYVKAPGTTKCIRVGNAWISWGQAAKECAEEGGHLLIIENDDVLQKLRAFLPEGKYHVGFNDVERENQYLWLDRTLVNTSMFNHQEPSDWRTGAREDCGNFWVRGVYPGLHDFICYGAHKFLCSLPTVE